jgi:hypothetical protein
MITLLLSLALAQPAADPADGEAPSNTGGPSIAAGIGLAQSTGLPVTGVDLSYHPATSGTSFVGRLAVGYGASWVYEELPSGRSRLRGLALRGPVVLRHEFGLTHVFPLSAQPMDVRLGVQAGGDFIFGELAPIGNENGGWVPKGLAIGELVRSAKTLSAVGVRMGAGSTAVAVCDPTLSLECIQWRPGFVGGIYAYIWAARKVQVEVEIGRTTWLTIGYRL